MAGPSSKITREPASAEKPKRGLRKWFVAGFLIVFIGLLIFTKGTSMTPAGDAVVVTPLWQYYLIHVNQSLNSSGNFGPTSGSGQAAVITFLQHAICSAVGGTILLGVGWVVCKKSNRGQHRTQNSAD